VKRSRWVSVGVLGGVLLTGMAAALAQSDDPIEEAPIRYSATPATDAVAKLQAQIDAGQVTLRRDPAHGYLASLLQQLKIPLSSQLLVYSKTSFQRDRISPITPRALYFNDRAYVGWVQGGSVVEISTVDPKLGAVFYTLSQEPAGKPKFVRQTHECLSCHGSTLTGGIPGHVMRSVYSGRDGLPILSAGTFITTDRSPWEERWGGWYVTGTHGAQRHMGNLTFKDATQTDRPNLSPGANVTSLKPYFETSRYLTPHADIVALMIAEHQMHVQNLIARASYETRRALQYEEGLNRELGKPQGEHWDSTVSRVKSAGEALVRGLLFCGEPELTAPVRGTAPYARDFEASGPRDPQGRSLRDLDLQRRMMKHPCSYLIYSEAFDALPAMAKAYVYRRLREVLSGQDTSKEFAHLSAADRAAVLEILKATKPEFAASLAAAPASPSAG
jgi:hypothetical protein